MIGKEYVGPAYWVHPVDKIVECEVISDHLGFKAIIIWRDEQWSTSKELLFFDKNEAEKYWLNKHISRLTSELEYHEIKVEKIKEYITNYKVKLEEL